MQPLIRMLELIKPEVTAKIVITAGAEQAASPVPAYGFIVSFEAESFSATVIPNGSGKVKLMEPSLIRLRFLVAEATPFLKRGVYFTFFEQGRVGHGHIL